MIDPLTICRMAEQGEHLEEETFDLERLYTILNELADRYDVRYDASDPVPADDALADRTWAAAVEFFTRCGVYFKDRQKLLHFDADTIERELSAPAAAPTFGEGDDAKPMHSRRPDSDARPWLHVGTGTVGSTEQIAEQIVYGNASIAAADSMSVCSLDNVDGEPLIAKTPSEIRGAIRSIQAARRACARAGREGLPILNGIAAAGTVTATIAAAHPVSGWRASDGIIVGAMAEFKTSIDMMIKAAFTKDSGCGLVFAACPLVGGYAGGPANTAIVNAAYAIFGRVMHDCDYYLSVPMQLRFGSSTTRDVLWASAVSLQAITRNTTLPVVYLPMCAGGPMTELYYREAAASIMTAAASGASIQTPHPARALLPDHVTPMEARISTEITLGCTGMSRAEAAPIVERLLQQYEGQISAPDVGTPYGRCYDVDRAEPTAEHRAFAKQIRCELTGAGVPLAEPAST